MIIPLSYNFTEQWSSLHWNLITCILKTCPHSQILFDFLQVFYRHLSFNIFLPNPWGKGDLGIWSKNNLQPILWWNREKLWAANSLENCILNTEKHNGFDTVRVQNNKENSWGINLPWNKVWPSPVLSSQSPSSVVVMWGGCTAQCLWTSQHFYIVAGLGSPVCPQLWLPSLSGPTCTKLSGLLEITVAAWLQSSLMGGGKATPRMRLFKPASPAGAFLNCPWFSLGVCG